MKRSKILSLILGVGMIGAVSVGITSTKAQEQTTGVQNVRVLTNRTTNQGYACVINGNGSLVLTNANGETTGYVSVGEMLSIKGQANGKTLVTVEETGISGYIDNSNMKMINSGVNSKLIQMNRRGHIINVSSDVHLRANATMDSSILANLSNSTNITITGQQGEWYRVNVNGVRGYIFGEYVGQGATQTGGVVNVVGNVNPTTIKNNNNNTVNTINPMTGTVGTTGITRATTSSKVVLPSGSVNGTTTKNTISNNEQHDNTPVKVVNHISSTTPNKEQHKEAPAKVVNHTSSTTPNKEQHKEAPAKVVNHTSSITPNKEQHKETPAKVVNHTSSTTPNKEQHKEAPAKVVNHTSSTTPNKEQHKEAPAKVVNHTSSTTPNKEQHKEAPAKVVNHTSSVTPNKEQHKNTSVIPNANTQITVGSQEFYNIINSEMIKLTNNYRTSHGLNALQGNSVLANMASWKANNCAKYHYFSDYTPNGQTVYQQPQFKDVRYATFAENLAEVNIGQSSGTISYADTKDIAEMCFGYLTGSPSHLANIMDSKATEIGIGVAVSSDGNVIVSQDFGANVTQ